MGLFSSKCRSRTRLDNKTVIVTGANTGMGKCIALDLYKRGARVIMACRNIEKANVTLEDITKQCQKQENVGTLTVLHLDLTSLDSVRDAANKILRMEEEINILINNAGVLMQTRETTIDGFEMTFETNYLAHFLFTLLLLPKMVRSAPSRIINVSSSAHFEGKINFEDLNFEKVPYNPLSVYSQSKLANVLFSKELACKLKEYKVNGVTVYTVDPGIVATDLGHFDKPYYQGLQRILHAMRIKTPEQGAQTSIYCAIEENISLETGFYYVDCKAAESSVDAKNTEDAKRLWDVSLDLVNLKGNYSMFM